MTRGDIQAGVDIDFAGTVGTQSMTYNTGVGNLYGVLLTRRSHNVTFANNAEVANFINCDIQGEYGGERLPLVWSETSSRTISAPKK